MAKNYYRSEYSDKQWKALIDKATELGCQITYSKYGNIVTIDSTDRGESRIIATTGRGEQDRAVWAHMTSRNKSIKCESFMACCRLNLSGLQENKLMNMQQEWA